MSPINQSNKAVNQSNKSLVLKYWAALDHADPNERSKGVATAMAADMRWHGHAPVGRVDGSERFLSEAWEPLRRSFPDLDRETFVFFAGTSNGRLDGDISKDGHQWVTGTGVFRATFAEDYLTIPATGGPVSIRWGEFCRVTDGRIDEVYFLIDVLDLLQQAGFDVLPPSLGVDGQYPPPAAGDGVLAVPQDDAATGYCLDRIRAFIFGGLNVFDREDLSSMGLAEYFDPDLQWYGPGGIGACLSFEHFENHHQRPWLVAYPDRQVQDLPALLAEGNYCGGPGWAGVKALHTGPYRGVEATGNAIDFNGLDWWKLDGEQFIENWVFVDMIHLFDQMGVDLFARMHAQIS
jgi:predicted ester cyclase